MNPSTFRRQFLKGIVAAATAAVPLRSRAAAATAPGDTIDVKTLGAFADGKLPDVRQIREAISLARQSRGGATIFFPPGDYYLGAIDNNPLLVAQGLRNVRFLGDRATLSCRTVGGQSDILSLVGCTNITIDGFRFRDHGMNREVNWLGAAAIRLGNDGRKGCENIDIRNCEFESVVSAMSCTRPDDFADRTRCRDIKLTNLKVSRSYYGFTFQDNGDHVVGRGLRCSDVRRSYFPYGVTDHDIEIEALNNATGFADILIKCYHYDTTAIRVKVKSRGKRSGDAIVILDQQPENGPGLIQKVKIDLDVDDADCRLDNVVLIRSLDRNGRPERQTTSRWDEITIDGDVKACGKTNIIEVGTVSATKGRLHIGPRLAQNRRVARSFPGFVVDALP